MNWRDDVEPFRYGGNNSRAGKPVVRYGPRPDEERRYHQQMAENSFYERFFHLKKYIEEFQAADDVQKKQVALEKLLDRCTLTSKKCPDMKEDDILYHWLFRRYAKKVPERLYRVSEGQLVLKKLFNEKTKEYITEKVFPLTALTLELRGYNEKDYRKSDLQVFVTFKDEMPYSWSKTIFGY